MWISFIFSTKCRNLPSHQSYVLTPQSLPLLLSIDMMSTLLWIPWQPKTEMWRVTGVCWVTRCSRHLVRVSGVKLFVQRAESFRKIQRKWTILSLLSLLQLDGKILLLRFLQDNLASGSPLCLCESVTTFTCREKCDHNVIIKDRKEQSCS